MGRPKKLILATLIVVMLLAAGAVTVWFVRLPPIDQSAMELTRAHLGYRPWRFHPAYLEFRELMEHSRHLYPHETDNQIRDSAQILYAEIRASGALKLEDFDTDLIRAHQVLNEHARSGVSSRSTAIDFAERFKLQIAPKVLAKRQAEAAAAAEIAAAKDRWNTPVHRWSYLDVTCMVCDERRAGDYFCVKHALIYAFDGRDGQLEGTPGADAYWVEWDSKSASFGIFDHPMDGEPPVERR